MSDNKIFKYLDAANSQGGDAAQDFLNKKMSKNKYMSVSNPDNPYSMGEGSIPSAPVYDKQPAAESQPKPDDSATKSISSEKGSLADLGFDQARIDEIRNHAQGASGADSFGYTADTKNNWKETQDSTSAGSIEADMRKIGKHLGYEHWGSANPERIKKYIMEQEKAPEAAAPVAEDKPEPIKHSPEIKQAKERVQSYEQDALSGKTSEEIFGKGEQLADNQYEFDSNQGATGIGASAASSSNEAATTATKSFLDKKVFDVKAKKNFQATV
jgi:hypothetical protein